MKTVNIQSGRFDPNNYEFNSKSNTGIMLIHGFTNTTYELRKLIDFLNLKKLHVVATNLPGHGTTVDECNRTKYSDWINDVEKKFADLSSTCDNTYVLGISMGALLAMHISTLFPVNGLISAAPVLEFNKPFKIHILNPPLCKIFKFRNKKYEFTSGQRISYGYDKWPLIALNEVRKLSKYVYKKVLPKINCPCLLIHSKEDHLSVFNNYNIIKNYIKSSSITPLIINQSPHNIFDCDIEKETIHQAIIDFINKTSQSSKH